MNEETCELSLRPTRMLSPLKKIGGNVDYSLFFTKTHKSKTWQYQTVLSYLLGQVSEDNRQFLLNNLFKRNVNSWIPVRNSQTHVVSYIVKRQIIQRNFHTRCIFTECNLALAFLPIFNCIIKYIRGLTQITPLFHYKIFYYKIICM